MEDEGSYTQLKTDTAQTLPVLTSGRSEEGGHSPSFKKRQTQQSPKTEQRDNTTLLSKLKPLDFVPMEKLQEPLFLS